MRSRRLLKPLLGLGVGGGLAGAVAYFRADSVERRKVRVNVNGVVRFCRSVCIGLRISADYWWAGYGLDEVGGRHGGSLGGCRWRERVGIQFTTNATMHREAPVTFDVVAFRGGQ